MPAFSLPIPALNAEGPAANPGLMWGCPWPLPGRRGQVCQSTHAGGRQERRHPGRGSSRTWVPLGDLGPLCPLRSKGTAIVPRQLPGGWDLLQQALAQAWEDTWARAFMWWVASMEGAEVPRKPSEVFGESK